jgi:hypothetical protein
MAVEGYIFQQYAESLKRPLQEVMGEVLALARAAGFRNIELSPAFFPPEGRDRTLSIIRSQGLLMLRCMSARSMHERGGADDAPPFRIRVGKSSRPTGSYRKHVAIRQAIWEFPERQFNVRTSYDKNAITVSATQTR